MGFTSRIVMVYSSKVTRIPLFGKPRESSDLRKNLEAALSAIVEMEGEFSWEPAAKEMLNDWHMSGGEPVPIHPRLQHYVGRRTINAVKLAMTMALSDGGLSVTLVHLKKALATLYEVEREMPEVFREMSVAGHAETLNEAYSFIVHEFLRGKRKPVEESKIVMFLQQRVPANMISWNLQTMIRSKMIAEVAGAVKAYIPRDVS